MLLSTSVIVCSTLVFVVLHYAVRILIDPLRDVPGPALARFTRLWELSRIAKGDFHNELPRLHQKFGPVVRLAPNRFSIQDVSSLNRIYGIGSKFTKSNFYNAFGAPDPRGRDHFSERDPAKHAAFRKKAANMYAMTSLLSYEPFVDETNRRFLARIEGLATASSRPVLELFDWMQFYAFDVIGELTVGKSFGLIEAGYDRDGLLRAAHNSNQLVGACVGLVPEWLWPVTLIWAAFPSSPLRIVYKCIFRELAKQRGGAKPDHREDFLSKTSAMVENGKMRSHELNAIIGQNIGAGSDTTGISLTAVIYHLTRHRECLHKLQAEIDEADATARLSETIQYREGIKLEYMQACIKEALRITPVGGMILPRVVPQGSAQIAGTYVPAGTVVGMSLQSVHEDESVWGEDVREFRPERWLGPKESVSVLDRHFVAFGYGSRTCIGRNISLMEMTKMLPALLRRFEFEPVNDDPWTSEGGWFVKPRYQVRVRLRAGKTL